MAVPLSRTRRKCGAKLLRMLMLPAECGGRSEVCIAGRMVTHGLRMAICAMLLTGVASGAAAQQNDVVIVKASDGALADALDIYATARTAFDRKEYSAAVVQFERTLALLDDAAPALRSTPAESAAADLALLTIGFLDLSRALAGNSQREPVRTHPNGGPGGSRFAHEGPRSSWLDAGFSG